MEITLSASTYIHLLLGKLELHSLLLLLANMQLI